MAIYDTGTASLAANGQVTGVGTQWNMPLTLIRVGATLVFKTEPVQIYTISEITSDTSMAVYNPNGETVPAGTGYAILAHDGISVQGLAQDVAETLRYYQSRETEIADAVDAFNNFDFADFDSKVTQVNTQHGDVVSIGAQVSNDAAQVSNDASSSQISATNASSAADRAEAAANSVSGSLTLNFSDGGTVESTNQQVLYINGSDVKSYVWTGSFPKAIPSDSTPDSTGGVQLGAWVSVGDASLRANLSSQDGLKLIGKSPTFESLRNIQPSVEGQLIILDRHSTISAGGGIFEAVQSSGLIDDNGLIAATSGSLYWKRKTKIVDPFMFGGVGDGVSDDSLAVKAAVASGYDVDLSGGDWLIDACTLQPENGVTVKGGTLIKNVYSTDIPLDGIADAPKFFYIAPGKKNITIDDVTFNYTGPVLPRVFGVVTHQSENVAVKNCRFTGNETAIFIWKLSKNTKITGNTIDKGQFGIATGGDNNGNTNGVVSGVFITKNNITGCNSEAIDINWDTQFAVIEDNRTYGNNIVDFEEEIDVGGGLCTDIRISNNTIDGGSGATRGIQIKESCRRVWVSNNRITTSATPAEYGGGICLGAYAGDSQDVWIEDNQISGFLTGVYATRNHVNIHILKNNISVAGTSGASYGIRVDMGTSYNINIKGNKVVGGSSTSNGIVVANTDGAVIEGNNVSGFSSGYGIQLSSTTRNARAYGNEVRGNGNGIINSGIKNIVHGNQVIGNAGRGMLIEGQYSTVSNNQIIDNNTAQGASVYGLVIAAGCNYSVVSGNNIFDTRSTKYQNGMQFGASDRVIAIGNITLPNAGTGVSGNGGLTNSQFASNITS